MPQECYSSINVSALFYFVSCASDFRDSSLDKEVYTFGDCQRQCAIIFSEELVSALSSASSCTDTLGVSVIFFGFPY